MKNFPLLILCLVACYTGIAQEATNISQQDQVERSYSSLQTGLLGLWINNEGKLAPSITLRGELGLEGGLFGGNRYEGLGFIAVPSIGLEPRWYFDLKKRYRKSKSIKGNSANYISVKNTFYPNWFAITNAYNVDQTNTINIVPTVGIRRVFDKVLNFEAGLGLGTSIFLTNDPDFPNMTSPFLVLHLRFGLNLSR